MTQEDIRKLVSTDNMKQFVRALHSVSEESDINPDDLDIVINAIKDGEKGALFMLWKILPECDVEPLERFVYVVGCLGYSLGRIDREVLRMMNSVDGGKGEFNEQDRE